MQPPAAPATAHGRRAWAQQRCLFFSPRGADSIIAARTGLAAAFVGSSRLGRRRLPLLPPLGGALAGCWLLPSTGRAPPPASACLAALRPAPLLRLAALHSAVVAARRPRRHRPSLTGPAPGPTQAAAGGAANRRAAVRFLFRPALQKLATLAHPVPRQLQQQQQGGAR